MLHYYNDKKKGDFQSNIYSSVWSKRVINKKSIKFPAMNKPENRTANER